MRVYKKDGSVYTAVLIRFNESGISFTSLLGVQLEVNYIDVDKIERLTDFQVYINS